MAVAIDNQLITETLASSRFVRVTPQKARRIAKLLRGKRVPEALQICKFLPQAVSENFLKTIQSAVANSRMRSERESTEFDEKIATLSRVLVDEGMTMKRMMPRAKGRGDRRLKRTCHITVVIDSEGGM
jgi:large subunit ribosomal protein L22